MIVQLRGVTDEFVNDLKAQTGKSTASKAFLHAADSYHLNHFVIADLMRENEKLQQRLAIAQAIIEASRGAALLMLDTTGQTNLDLPEGH